jgi:hypothetical protein
MAFLKQVMQLLLQSRLYNKDTKLLINLKINIGMSISINNLITTVLDAHVCQEPTNILSIWQKGKK